MSQKYTWRFRVRSYEVGAAGIVKPAVYLNYLEEGAIEASASFGYDYDWYMRQQHLWLVRKLTLRYLAPARTDDELELTTWISDIRRVQSNREYALGRVRDGAPIVRARHNWVYVNMATLLPERVPAEFIERLQPTGEQEDLDIGLSDPVTIDAPCLHVEERRARYHELDQNAHVNNAVYIDWVEQSITTALREAGWPPERLHSADFTMQHVAHEMEYFRSALDDEPIRIETQLAEIGGDRAAWTNDIKHGLTGELIARDRTVFAFTDAEGACPMPDELRLALTLHS